MSRARRKHRFQRQVLEQLALAKAQGRLLPGVYEMRVMHDDWCAFLTDEGLCNCNPTVGRPERKPAPEDN